MQTIGGATEVMPVEDIVAWLANRNRSGKLSFSRGNVERSFIIEAGQVLQGASSDTREYLGQHLINFGYIDEEQLEKAFQTQRETHVPLGRILVMVGQLDEEQLRRALSFKVRESLLDTLEWQLGSFEFELGETGRRELDLEIPVSLAEVHSEGQSRRNMWEEMRKIFISGDLRFEVVSQPEGGNRAEAYLLGLLAKGMTISDLLLEMRALEFHVYARLYDLHERGHIRPQLREQRAGTGDVSRATLQSAMARRDYGTAYAAAQALLDADPHDAEALAALRSAQQHLTIEVDHGAVDRSQVPHLLGDPSEISSAEYNAKERYVLSRMDGQRTLNQIIQVSPISEVEFLGVIERLRRQGVIELG